MVVHSGLINASPKKHAVAITNDIRRVILTDKEGIATSLDSLHGKTLFINFWAVWCPPCIAEMSTIDRLRQRVANDSNIVFLLVDADGDLTKANAFMKKNHYQLPVYQLSTGTFGRLYTGVLPTTLIINGRGDVVQQHEGLANYDNAKMVEWLQALQ